MADGQVKKTRRHSDGIRGELRTWPLAAFFDDEKLIFLPPHDVRGKKSEPRGTHEKFRLSFFLLLLPRQASGADAELHGYLRAGTGTNGKGAKEECIYNRGSPANEFRLGNECAIYGETALLAHILKRAGQ